jgi:hypothetical protein
MRDDSELTGTAFELETTGPVGARPVKVGLEGSIVGGAGGAGGGIGIYETVGLLSTQVPFTHMKPSGHGGCIPQFCAAALGAAAVAVAVGGTSSAKPSHALQEFKYKLKRIANITA